MKCFRRRKPKHHHHLRIFVETENFSVQLHPNMEIVMAQNLPVDQIDTIQVVAVDKAGNVQPLPSDAVSTFSNSTPATATDAPSGNTDVLTPVAGAAVGATTTLSVSVVTGGNTFTFSDTYTLVAGTIAGVQFQNTFSPKP